MQKYRRLLLWRIKVVTRINEQECSGEVKIADDVIAVIAGIAATEVTGVARMCGISRMNW